MTLPEFLTQDKDGYIHLTGHRIGLVDLVHFYQHGDSAEMLAARFPTVPLPIHHKVIAFYLENQSEWIVTSNSTIAISLPNVPLQHAVSQV